jgi:cell division transport system permease protein
VAAAVLLFGVVISLLCAYLSINRYLRMKAETLYYI